VGPQRAALLKKLDLSTVQDLLYYFPRDHDDRSQRIPIKALRPGPGRSVRGKISFFDVQRLNKFLALGTALLTDGTGSVRALWFRRASFRFDVFSSLRKRLQPGMEIIVHGLVEQGRGGLQLRVEDFEPVTGEGDSTIHTGRIVPVYPLTEGVDMRGLREMIWRAVTENAPRVRETLPEAFRAAHGLGPLDECLRDIHFPADFPARDRARRRFAFEEFFFLELALARVRSRREDGPPAVPCVPTKTLLTPFREALGYDFTNAQKRVINEVFADMARPKPMSRLLQGDVGSGKTVVAASALLLAVENGLQGALMAPTEILAEQHFRTLTKLLDGLPAAPALLTSALKKKDRTVLLEKVKAGEVRVLVGTHALLEEDVAFKKLGLAVIDEQHRFGVRQRSLLQKKAVSPHVLVMTATPIPRTLALTLYGDLAVSVIDQLPPGRTPIRTHWTLEGNALAAVRKAVSEGRQAYVVLPLADVSEKMELRAAVEEHERLQKLFPDLKVGLLHGRLKSAEKDAVMGRFKAGEIHVLVATPVIEVGVDVPNATVMVIVDADRFGLAQLHQLRGRVGRGAHASDCYLVSEAKSVEAAERLRLLCATTDGFRLAEADLEKRGPGEFLGEAQHGLPAFKAGDLVRDGALIQEARDAAFGMTEKDPLLGDPAHRPFLDELRRRFDGRMTFGRVA
jgi:ATP-dependent DNA helicase RecG